MGGIKKVLIIANSRSGSKNIMISFHKYLGIRYRAEPWNYSIPKQNRSIEIEDEIVLKTLADQSPEGVDLDLLYNTIIPKFDLVILLSRKNRQEVYESFQHFVNEGIDWHSEWEKNGEMVISEGVKNAVDNQYVCIDKVRDRYNIPITWYEDLYSGDYDTFKEVTKDWGIDTEVFFDYFNPNNRLRKN